MGRSPGGAAPCGGYEEIWGATGRYEELWGDRLAAPLLAGVDECAPRHGDEQRRPGGGGGGRREGR